MLLESVEEYSADATRFALADAGDRYVQAHAPKILIEKWSILYDDSILCHFSHSLHLSHFFLFWDIYAINAPNSLILLVFFFFSSLHPSSPSPFTPSSSPPSHLLSTLSPLHSMEDANFDRSVANQAVTYLHNEEEWARLVLADDAAGENIHHLITSYLLTLRIWDSCNWVSDYCLSTISSLFCIITLTIPFLKCFYTALTSSSIYICCNSHIFFSL